MERQRTRNSWPSAIPGSRNWKGRSSPPMFADDPQKQSDRTGLPNAGAAADEDMQTKRWEKLAGLSDDDE